MILEYPQHRAPETQTVGVHASQRRWRDSSMVCKLAVASLCQLNPHLKPLTVGFQDDGSSINSRRYNQIKCHVFIFGGFGEIGRNLKAAEDECARRFVPFL